VLSAKLSQRSAISRSRSSARVMSGTALIACMRRSACASIRPDRRSPPRGFGAVRPGRRYASIQRTALAMLTPNRRAAALRDMPACTAPITRMRRSAERY
jgi:hypothetical protein